ncbi:aminotransferase class V-fold PLP-dependent enzyme [Pseudooceanicola sp. HF7]|uniref:aminotransferase class V-fold PLP-dependent enzyme n=1 Tax=Pseudooceanicola sp. HF7 TaxID=2721560 RepID=UPI00143140EF|nr:aminotransferase class V-fold PLP-dependent enzyme [Pseudooceanicola sp. HF7]NIZ07914.1 aminotransferase class V-fold PLP-dependent enzyme [Pseudooceanicola sp. HF7]
MDIEELRRATPAIGNVVHFNAASSGLVPVQVLSAMVAHLEAEAGLAPHEAGVASVPAREGVRAEVAALIGAQPSEVAFAEGSSQAWNAAFAALPELQPGDRVLVGRHEWGGNVFTLMQACARRGARLEVIPAGPDGRSDPGALSAMLDDRVRLIVMTWMPAHCGIAEPVAEVGRIARAAGVPYFLDAAQALGVVPVDVTALGCDVLAAPGRKGLRGPKGSGILYVRQDFLERLTPGGLNVRAASWTGTAPELRADAGRFESNECAPAGILGLGAAVRLAAELGVAALAERSFGKAASLRGALRAVPGVRLREEGLAESHITTFTHVALSPAEVMQRLADQRITVNAVPAAYGPLVDLPQAGVIRASVSYLTTEEEIGHLAEALSGI